MYVEEFETTIKRYSTENIATKKTNYGCQHIINM